MDAAAATSHGAPARAQSHGKADSLPLWTVQAIATTDKGDAKAWLDRLKAKGFDAFVVEAEIKGQSWFRVRVGNLSSRQEAEALGKTLRSQEGFHDAFIAQSSEEEVILAANSR
jgi:DedD protein